MSTDKELFEAVLNLNEGVPEALMEDGIAFNLHTCGYSSAIDFGGINLWCSENDDREWDDEADDYGETVEQYCVRKYRELTGQMAEAQFYAEGWNPMEDKDDG